MPNITIGFGAVLCAIGLFGYFGSALENRSPTAFIPAVFGVLLIICGLLAHKAVSVSRNRVRALFTANTDHTTGRCPAETEAIGDVRSAGDDRPIR